VTVVAVTVVGVTVVAAADLGMRHHMRTRFMW
jgi:hypothetical protein